MLHNYPVVGIYTKWGSEKKNRALSGNKFSNKVRLFFKENCFLVIFNSFSHLSTASAPQPLICTFSLTPMIALYCRCGKPARINVEQKKDANSMFKKEGGGVLKQGVEMRPYNCIIIFHLSTTTARYSWCLYHSFLFFPWLFALIIAPINFGSTVFCIPTKKHIQPPVWNHHCCQSLVRQNQ